MSTVNQNRALDYGNYQLIKTTPGGQKTAGIIDQGSTKDNVLDLSNPDKIIAELTQDKVQFIKVADDLYLKLDLTDKATAVKLLSELKTAIKAQKGNLSQDFSPLVFEKALGLKVLPDNNSLKSFNEVSLADNRLKSLSGSEQDLQKMGEKIAVSVDDLLENPEKSAKLGEGLKDLREALYQTGENYRNKLFLDPLNLGKISPEKKALLEKSPALELLKELNTLIPKDYQPGKEIPAEKMENISKLLAQIPKNSPEYEKIKQIVTDVKAILSTLAFEKRIVNVSGNPETAVKIAEKLAQSNPEKGFAIIDQSTAGAKKFAVVEYPKAAIPEKKAQAKESSGNLIAFFSKDGAESRLGSQKVNSGKLDDDFKSRLTAGSGAIVDTKALDDPQREAVILNQVTEKAKEVVLKQYDRAITRFETWTKDEPEKNPGNSDLLKTVITLGKMNKRDIEQSLQDIFKMKEGATTTVMRAAQLSDFCDKFQEAGKSGKEAQMKVIKEYRDLFSALKTSVTEPLAKLKEEKAEILSNKGAEAGFQILKDYPSVRQEVYRQLGFNLEPDQFPPYEAKDLPGNSLFKSNDSIYQENQGMFTSTAEMVFARRAEGWDDLETAKRAGKTAAIVVGSVVLTAITKIPPAAIGLGGAALGSGLEIKEAKHEADQAKIKYYSGFTSEKEMKQAEVKLGLSFISAAINLGSAGVSSALASPTLLKSFGQDLLINFAQTAVDPLTYYGAQSAEDVLTKMKDNMLTNIVMGGTLSFVHLKVGEMKENFQTRAMVSNLEKLNGQKVEAFLSSESGQLMIKAKGAPESSAVKIDANNITKAENGQLEIKIPGTEAKVTMEVDTMKMGFAKKDSSGYTTVKNKATDVLETAMDQMTVKVEETIKSKQEILAKETNPETKKKLGRELEETQYSLKSLEDGRRKMARETDKIINSNFPEAVKEKLLVKIQENAQNFIDRTQGLELRKENFQKLSQEFKKEIEADLTIMSKMAAETNDPALKSELEKEIGRLKKAFGEELKLKARKEEGFDSTLKKGTEGVRLESGVEAIANKFGSPETMKPSIKKVHDLVMSEKIQSIKGADGQPVFKSADDVHIAINKHPGDLSPAERKALSEIRLEMHKQMFPNPDSEAILIKIDVPKEKGDNTLNGFIMSPEDLAGANSVADIVVAQRLDYPGSKFFTEKDGKRVLRDDIVVTVSKVKQEDVMIPFANEYADVLPSGKATYDTINYQAPFTGNGFTSSPGKNGAGEVGGPELVVVKGKEKSPGEKTKVIKLEEFLTKRGDLEQLFVPKPEKITYLAADNQELTKALGNETVEKLPTAEKVQQQLKALGKDSEHFKNLPSVKDLQEKGVNLVDDPNKRVVFQTYGANGPMIGQMMLEMNTKDLNGIHYGTVTIKGKEKIPTGAEVNQDLANKTPIPEASKKIELTLDGTGPNEVSKLARNIGSEMNGNIAPVMLEETAMLKNADVIYFGLTGKEGNYQDSVTTGELLAILNDPELFQKVVFFRLDDYGIK